MAKLLCLGALLAAPVDAEIMRVPLKKIERNYTEAVEMIHSTANTLRLKLGGTGDVDIKDFQNALYCGEVEVGTPGQKINVVWESSLNETESWVCPKVLGAQMVQGWWGEVTASVDWCEENYVVSGYVAEWWNTLTALALAWAGWALFHSAAIGGPREARFVVASLVLLVVGLGSVAFHGTMLYEYQMWDEVPMLLLASSFLYILFEQYEPGQQHAWLPIGLVIYCTLSISGTMLLSGNAQWYFFQTSFATMWTQWLFHLRRFFCACKDSTQDTVDILHTMRCALVLWATAGASWLTDIKLCRVLQQLPYYNHWNLHAWAWHTLIAAAVYYALIALLAHRKRLVLGQPVYIVTSAGWPSLTTSTNGRNHDKAA